MRMKKVTEEDIAAVEELYGIKLPEYERMLALTSRNLLSHLEGQHAFLLGMALTAIHCPACGMITCQRAASLDEDWMNVADEDYACHLCHMPLRWVLPFTGQAFFVVEFERSHLQPEIAARRAAAKRAS